MAVLLLLAWIRGFAWLDSSAALPLALIATVAWLVAPQVYLEANTPADAR